MAELTGPKLLTRTQAFFKEVLPMAAESLINGETVLASNLERVSKGIVIGPPAKARVPLRIGRNPAVGARSFKGALPKPGNSRWASTLVTLGYNYGTLYIPGQYFKAKTADAAFGNYLTEESEALVESLKLDYNRQLLGDATGILATCGVMGAPGDVIPVSDTKWFYIDQIVDIRTTAPLRPRLSSRTSWTRSTLGRGRVGTRNFSSRRTRSGRSSRSRSVTTVRSPATRWCSREDSRRSGGTTTRSSRSGTRTRGGSTRSTSSSRRSGRSGC